MDWKFSYWRQPKPKPTFRLASFLGVFAFLVSRFGFALGWDMFVRSLAFLRAGLREVNRASPISSACYFQWIVLRSILATFFIFIFIYFIFGTTIRKEHNTSKIVCSANATISTSITQYWLTVYKLTYCTYQSGTWFSADMSLTTKND